MIKMNICRHGRMMYPDTDLYIGRALNRYGEAQQAEVDFLCRLIKPGDVVIEIGAHIGALTVPLAQRVGADGYVVAIEPQMFLFYVLCGNLALNGLGNTQALNRAASNASGAVLFFPEADYGVPYNFGNVSGVVEFGVKNDVGWEHKRPMATLAVDDLALARPNLIKIDVEGMEGPVLEGCLKSIQRANPVLYIEFGSQHEGVVKLLRRIGYEWTLHEPPLFNPDNFAGEKENVLVTEGGVPLVSGNLFCWPKGRRPDVADQHLVDLDASEQPRHRYIKRLRDASE